MHVYTHKYVYIYVQDTSSLPNLLLLLFLCTHTYITHMPARKHTCSTSLSIRLITNLYLALSHNPRCLSLARAHPRTLIV